MNRCDIDLPHPQLNNDILASAMGVSSTETERNEGQERGRPDEARQVLAIPLGQWDGVDRGQSHNLNPLECSMYAKASLIRKVTVAYALAHVLQHFLDCQYSIDEVIRLIYVDNFVVRMRVDEQSDLGWEVEGVYVISPELAVQIRAKWIPSSSAFDTIADDITGRDVDATLKWNTRKSRPNFARQVSGERDYNERMLCYLLGRVLSSLFCAGDSQSWEAEANGGLKNYRDTICDPPSFELSSEKNDNSAPTREQSFPEDGDEMPPTKKTASSCGQMKSLDISGSLSIRRFSSDSTLGSGKIAKQNMSDSIIAQFTPILNAGYPSALSQLVSNLLDCGSDLFQSDDSYLNLDEVIHDLHILLENPGRFVFDQYRTPSRDQKLAVNKDKLYGREAEVTLLKDAFCRVASSGCSEAVFVAGFSGCGKTRLVQNIFESVDAAGGYVVVQKFDETSTHSPLFVVMSALNDLCGQIVETHSPEELRELFRNIRDSTNLTLLARVLPNIARMNSSDSSFRLDPFNHAVSSGVNFHMLVFAVMRLMRIISSRSNPILLFLDDLQWADTASLDLVHSILSDLKGSNCVFFVGSYRNQDVKQGHFVFEFIYSLSAYEVPCTELNLEGLTEDDVNHMLSDALLVLPRLCRSLSSIVYHKTRGSPFFTFEFLKSLIDRGVLVYSLRERRWVWDIDQVHSEDITDNVLEIISDKMALLDDADQRALEVAACFGSNIHESFVLELSKTPMFTNLYSTLDKAVANGFIERYGSNYRFVHDKVREAAYSLIESKDEYHFNIGMSLYSILTDQSKEHNIPNGTVLAQINHGVPLLLTCKEKRSFIAQLNYKESLKSFERSDFTSAYRFGKASVSLLPENTWTNNYDYSLKYFFQFAKAAYTCAHIREAIDSLNEIINYGRGLEDTHPSYLLLTKILLLSYNDQAQAFHICRNVLHMLGEDVPEVEHAKLDLTSQVTKAKTLMNDSEVLHGKQVQTQEWRDLAIMQAYYQLITITYISHPEVTSHYAGRWAQYTVLNNVSCRYTARCIVTLAAILCRDMSQDARIGYKFGRKALAKLDSSYLDDAAYVFLIFYGFVGELFEPIQACVDMLHRGYEMAMQAGNLSDAAFHKIFRLSQCMKTGMNLSDLKKEIDSELSMSTHRSQTFMASRLRSYRKTIQTLIGDESTPHSAHFNDDDSSTTSNLIETQILDEVMCAAYLGNLKQSHYLSKLYLESPQTHRSDSILQRSVYIAFYFGISVVALYRRKPDQQQLMTLNDLVLIIAKAVKFSEWNFKNKVALLRAELASVKDDEDEAEYQYDIAIASGRSSKFIHEEGLAYELAGLHYKNHFKETKALNSFREAEKCYQEWGSKVKAIQMRCEIQSLAAFGQNIFGET